MVQVWKFEFPQSKRGKRFTSQSWSRGFKPFSCSTQLSMKFQVLITTKLIKKYRLFLYSNSQICIYQAKLCSNANIFGILTFMSKINFMLSCIEHENGFITLGLMSICLYFILKSRIFLGAERTYFFECLESFSASLFFSKSTFSKDSFKTAMRVSNSLNHQT